MWKRKFSDRIIKKGLKKKKSNLKIAIKAVSKVSLDAEIQPRFRDLHSYRSLDIKDLEFNLLYVYVLQILSSPCVTI